MKMEMRFEKYCSWDGSKRWNTYCIKEWWAQVQCKNVQSTSTRTLMVIVEIPRTSIGIAILSGTLAIIAVIVTISNKKKVCPGAYRYRMGGRKLPSKVTVQLAGLAYGILYHSLLCTIGVFSNRSQLGLMLLLLCGVKSECLKQINCNYSFYKMYSQSRNNFFHSGKCILHIVKRSWSPLYLFRFVFCDVFGKKINYII